MEGIKLPTPEMYEYSPLPITGRIRLLVIEPSNHREDLIRCRLDDYETSSQKEYDALSYTWGNDDAIWPILVNEKRFFVRRNLYSALCVLRSSTQERTLWVDAICINQQDIGERDQQVLQMGDIFARAQRVNIWLGDSDHGSDEGIRFLDEFYRTLDNVWGGNKNYSRTGLYGSGGGGSNSIVVPEFRVDAIAAGDRASSSLQEYLAYYLPIKLLIESPAGLSGLNNAVDLLRRPWWKRMWTLQESVLCQQAVCLCGDETISLSSITTLSYFVYSSPELRSMARISCRLVSAARDCMAHGRPEGASRHK